MIDKDGKIFKLINVIDLFVIIVCIGVGFFLVRRLSNSSITTSETTEVILKFYTEDVTNFVAQKVDLGARVEDEGKGIYLGNIIDKKEENGFVFVPTNDGKYLKATKEGTKSLEISTTLKAQVVDHGININGNIYGVGHSLTIRAGHSKIYCRVSDIEKKG